MSVKDFDVKKLLDWLQAHMVPLSAETLGWLAVILIHSATIPTLLATVDLVLLVWAGLTALFAQACVQRNMLQIITISVGFILQSSLMALIFFR